MMRKEAILAIDVRNEHRTEAAYGRVDELAAQHRAEITGLAERYYDTYAEEIGDTELTHQDFMRRYDEQTAGYAWAAFSREAFEQRMAALDMDAASLLKVRIGVHAASTVAHLENMALHSKQSINGNMMTAEREAVHFDDLATELVDLCATDLEAMRDQIVADPETYRDVRFKELAAAIKTLASNRAVEPPKMPESYLEVSSAEDTGAFEAAHDTPVETAQAAEITKRASHEATLGSYVTQQLVGKIKQLVHSGRPH